MIFVDNENEHDASLNLALEEYVLREAQTTDDILLFYINAPSIIIGRHQNTIEEINREYVEKHGIRIVRRLSGGGAVYHDLGNLNFSFITTSQPENFRNFKKFTEPIIRGLAKLGIPAELSGRNDILVDGRKVSGNAQYVSKSRMVSHGTLLFNSDLSNVSEALNVHESKITSKGIKSVRSRVANISEFMGQPMEIEAFRAYLLQFIFEGCDPIPTYPLSERDWAGVRKLAEERYRSWDWTYGHSPEFNVQKRQRFPSGEIDARLNVQQGVIRSAKFYGDFFSEIEPSAIEKMLVGVRYNQADIATVLQQVEIDRYFSGLDRETFVDFIG